MSESSWDFFQCNVNDKPASIYVDLALKDIAPDSTRETILCVWVYLNYPNSENGLSTPQEFDVLCAIEDALSKSMADTFSAVYAGRITNDGRREYYFYSSNSTSIELEVATVLNAIAPYRFDAWAEPDPQWNQYLTLLYPNNDNLRWIHDRRVVEALGKRGDLASVPRPIQHWSYFRNESDRSKFERSVREKGFEVVDQTDPGREDLSYALTYRKSQPATLAEVYRTTSFLEELSSQFDGDYDGWESVLVTDPEKK